MDGDEYRPEARQARGTAGGAANPSAHYSKMTGVWCQSCGTRYHAPVDPRIVQAIRRCSQCGQKALVVET
jgi:DNA-directed RNA polymerase subunit RPC12/RpoP